MTQFHNNNLLHNLRVGQRMVQEGMHPEVASLALAKEGILAPAPLLEAVAQPGVLESMSAKPYTHARANQQIAAHQNMRATLAAIPRNEAAPEPKDDAFAHLHINTDD